MDEPKLFIPPKKYTEESSVVSMRLPKDMIREIDAIAKNAGRTRTDVMILCLEFALEHMVRSDPSEKKRRILRPGTGDRLGADWLLNKIDCDAVVEKRDQWKNGPKRISELPWEAEMKCQGIRIMISPWSGDFGN
jgi:hypothetical protein